MSKPCKPIKQKDQEEASDPSPTNAVNNGRVFEEIIEFSRSTATLLQSASRLHTTLWWIDADVSPPPGFSSAVTVATVNVSRNVITNGSKLEAQAVRQIKLYQSIRNYALHLSKTGTSFTIVFQPTSCRLCTHCWGPFFTGFRAPFVDDRTQGVSSLGRVWCSIFHCGNCWFGGRFVWLLIASEFWYYLPWLLHSWSGTQWMHFSIVSTR